MRALAPAFGPGGPTFEFAAGARVQLRPKAWARVKVGEAPFGVYGGTAACPLRETARYGTVVAAIRRTVSHETARTVALNGVRIGINAERGAVAVVVIVENDDGNRRSYETGALWPLPPGDDPAFAVCNHVIDFDAADDEFRARRTRTRFVK